MEEALEPYKCSENSECIMLLDFNYPIQYRYFSEPVEVLFKLYEENLTKNPLRMWEEIKGNIPLLIDLDIYIRPSIQHIPYTLNSIQRFSKEIITQYEKTYILPDILTCVVFGREKAYSQTKTVNKNGLHIIIPELRLSLENHKKEYYKFIKIKYKYLILEIPGIDIQRIDKSIGCHFDEFMYKPNNKLGWLVLGSGKSGLPPYKPIYILEYNTKTHTFTQKEKTFSELLRLCSISLHRNEHVLSEYKIENNCVK